MRNRKNVKCINEKEYFNYFGVKDSLQYELKTYNTEECLKEAMKIALDTRKFEIELYWKRTSYFVLFIGAVFIGYYTVHTSNLDKDSFFLKILLACLGFLLSWLWYASNRGSKFWQENWEEHISVLSQRKGYPVFDIIYKKEVGVININDSYPFSLSKINQMVSLIITFSWGLLLLFLTIKYILPPEWFDFSTSIKKCFYFAFIIFCFVALVILKKYIESFATIYVFSKGEKEGFFLKTETVQEKKKNFFSCFIKGK